MFCRDGAARWELEVVDSGELYCAKRCRHQRSGGGCGKPHSLARKTRAPFIGIQFNNFGLNKKYKALWTFTLGSDHGGVSLWMVK